MLESLIKNLFWIIGLFILEELFNFWRQIITYHLKFDEEKNPKQDRLYYTDLLSWGISIIGLGYFILTTIIELEKQLVYPIINNGFVRILIFLFIMIVLVFVGSALTIFIRENILITTRNSKIGKLSFILEIANFIFYPITTYLVKTDAKREEDKEKIDTLNEEEIIAITEESVKEGSLDKFDLEYLKRAFELNDKVATDIMVDRTSLKVINITASVKEAINKYLELGFSRYPVVADNNKDKILGYVFIYDLIRQARVDDSISINRVLRSIITVPETTKLHNLLSQMITNQTPIVVAVDEYGGTSGIITDKDIYEEFFGTVHDEIDDVSDEYIQNNKNDTYSVSGKTTLYDFERYFKIEIKEFDESESTTIAGFINEIAPDLKQGESVDVDNFNFEAKILKRGFIKSFTVKKNK